MTRPRRIVEFRNAARAASVLSLLGAAPAGAMSAPAPATPHSLERIAGTRLGEAVSAIAPNGWADAAAVFIDAEDEPVGAAFLRGAPTGIFIRVAVDGLSPGWHGIHFHKVGDCSDGVDGFKKSGPHVDPDDHEHGLMQSDGAERGDLPNLYAGRKGLAVAEFFRPGVAVWAAQNDLSALIDEDGFAVVVHAASDDQTSQPIGGAGARVACAAFTDKPVSDID